MDKKGQMSFGIFISIFIGVIIGLLLLQASAVYVEQGTRSSTGVATITAKQYAAPGSGTVRVLDGQELVELTSVTNATGDDIAAANYTVAECVRPTDGLKGICYTSTGVGEPPANGAVNITYTYYPEGYIDSSGGRSIASLIIIFFALAIAAIALVPSIRSGVMDMLSR